jgi:hypothetical protein
MTPALIRSAVELADVLARENAALAALDLAGAAAMLPEKSRAASAFAEQAHADSGDDGPPALLARHVAERLCVLAEENRRLLERGIAVQGRVIACIARAVPRSGVPRYGANGGLTGERARPLALSSRA